MTKNLLIVESPAKAKTIQKYLGKDFEVKSSFGHIRDLDKGNKGVDIKNNFKPKYIVSPEKKKVVADLRKSVKNANEVWLATDEDREGEAIAWHLCQVLKLNENETKRIVFREITKSAIQKAVDSPRKVDLNLVNAQQARRVLDRLVGFELSELLWRKVKGGLSAGRVQSVAVKLIVDKEREIQQFESSAYFKVEALFGVSSKGKSELKAELPRKLSIQDDARSFLEKCSKSHFWISKIEKKPVQKKPSPPFTTSTLQQEASRKLGFAVKRTMSVAQRLYERGFITYMRTDSTSLSSLAINTIAAEIKQRYGDKYSKIRQYKGKKALAQEAHEAIRPTYIERKEVSDDRDQQRLYELIWKRTIASQMANAELERTNVEIAISEIEEDQFKATGEVLKFDGFLKVYLAAKDDDEEDETKGMLPPLSPSQKLDLIQAVALERHTKPPARYSEAGLVKKLEELGIGRPSTYAPTITKIMEEARGYVEKRNSDGVIKHFALLKLKDQQIIESIKKERYGTIKNRLFAKDMGILVSDFLTEHFVDIMEYSFTARIEKEFDKVAGGKTQWTSLLGEFYQPFHKQVSETLDHSERATGERILGKNPDDQRTVLVRMSRFGPVVQIGQSDELAEGEKPRYANMKPGQSMETITFEEAMELFRLPREVGTYKGETLTIANGRFGPYVKYADKFISIPRAIDPLEISFNEIVNLVIEREKADAPVGKYKGEAYTKGKGRFGPFLKWKNLFVNVPKRYNFENLSTADAHELIEAKIQKEANRYIHQWPEENISVENGRWGPFIRFKKKNVKIPKINGEKVTSEMAKDLKLEDVKKMIEAQLPGSFKKSKPKKKANPKKTVKKR